MSQMDKILDGLIRRTNDGKLNWRRSVREDDFIASVDAISVVVRGFRRGRLSDISKYQIEIKDAQGSSVGVLETNDEPDVDVAPDRQATLSQTHQVKRLYTLARRSALNPDATLDKLAKALES
ncbi:MAG: hypothetical protein F4X64_07155 [Chloroflexi bacterium]|nr:hypothetical protein [Chloroflexota bacterium]